MQSKTTDVRERKGFGFKDEQGHIYLQRCFKCGRENWAPRVASGICAWCGFDSNSSNWEEFTAQESHDTAA